MAAGTEVKRMTGLEQITGMAGDGNQFLTFTLGDENYAVDILRVQEIKGFTKVTQIPNTPPFIKGVLNLRGTIVPIVDLRTKFGMDQVEHTMFTCIVVVVVEDRIMGIIVDAVSDVLNIAEDDIQPAPNFGTKVDTSFIQSIARTGEKLTTLLDIDRVLAAGELHQVKLASTAAAAAEADQQNKTGLTGLKVEALEKSFKLVAPQGEQLVHRFYERLFEKYPAVKPLFKNTTIAEQEKKLLASLVLVIQNLRHPDKLTKVLQDLGGRHVEYGAKPAHYDAVAETLLAVLGEFAGPAWTADVKQAWADALTAIKGVMLSRAT